MTKKIRIFLEKSQKHIDNLKWIIIMQYQKIINLLENTPDLVDLEFKI